MAFFFFEFYMCLNFMTGLPVVFGVVVTGSIGLHSNSRLQKLLLQQQNLSFSSELRVLMHCESLEHSGTMRKHP